MKLLIVEDDRNKERQINEHIRAVHCTFEVQTRRSYQSGLKEIVHWSPDIVVLDMSLRTYDISATERGGRTRAFAGREVLHEMQRRGLSAKVVIVTQYESFVEGGNVKTLSELTEELQDRYSSNYIGTVYYHPSKSTWRSELDSVLHSLTGGGRS